MGGRSEREYRENLSKIRERLNNRDRDVQKDFEKIGKMKIEALKQTEEMRASTFHDIEQMEKDIIKSKDLAPESKARLHTEIAALKNEVEQKYGMLKTRISKTLTPALAEQLNY